MRVIDPGHTYALQLLDGIQIPGADTEVKLEFVKREGEMYPGNVGHHEGTNCQEVLRACADRLLYLYNQIPDDRTHLARLNIEGAILLLEERAAERHGREFHLSIDEAIHGETCKKCGHVGCKGECHA